MLAHVAHAALSPVVAQIREYQGSGKKGTQNLIPRAPFMRLVREVLHDNSDEAVSCWRRWGVLPPLWLLNRRARLFKVLSVLGPVPPPAAQALQRSALQGVACSN